MILAQLPPCCELKTSELVGPTLKWQVVGLALLATHVILTKLSLVTFFPIALFALGWLFYKAPLAGLLIFFQWLIYQNWVLSIFSVGMDYTTFTMLQGSSFAALVIMASISFTRLTPSKRWRHLNGRLFGAARGHWRIVMTGSPTDRRWSKVVWCLLSGKHIHRRSIALNWSPS
jgi:hypothetical protein